MIAKHAGQSDHLALWTAVRAGRMRDKEVGALHTVLSEAEFWARVRLEVHRSPPINEIHRPWELL